MYKSRGFTLLETAVVLVLAGMIVSGILRGHEIVSQARAKFVINDLTAINAATLMYYDRYKAWPGDDANAGGPLGRWSVFNAKGGNGDGVVAGNYNDLFTGDPITFVDGATNESLKFWWHLRISGFAMGPLTGPGAAAPPVMPVGGILGVQTSDPNFFIGLMACVSNVPERMATMIDTQLDDQLPNSGYLRGRRQNPNDDSPALAVTNAVPNYIEDGSSRYVLCQALQGR
ncbi:MAG: type II secretion system protein [Burkholderiales bacterium]